MNRHEVEVSNGERFEFGENWRRFLETLSQSRIEEAKASLRKMLDCDNLCGRKFLDIGSGSGLFSLAARLLGAEVVSFDFDPKSVACTKELRRRYFDGDSQWTVETGSVLDKAYLAQLGDFDIVYSWGVLHHTGALWEAIENASTLVRPKGQFFIAVYNDQGVWSKRWKVLKKVYNKLPPALRLPYAIGVMGTRELNMMLVPMLKLKFSFIYRQWSDYGHSRGMHRWHDMIDWIGGYPFEVAKPDEIFAYLHARGFTLQKMTTTRGDLGCNEFVFVK